MSDATRTAVRPKRQAIPANVEAEESLLGAMILDGEARRYGLEVVEPEDFFMPAHGQIFSAIAALHDSGQPVDSLTVRDEWQRRSGVEVDGGRLVGLLAGIVSVAHANHYAREVVKAAMSRREHQVFLDAAESLREGADPYEMADRVTTVLGELDAPLDGSNQESLSMADMVDDVEAIAPWVILGMMRSDWRAVVLAPPGQGKSTLLRQIAMLAAQGRHPLRPGVRFKAIRSLVVDLENPVAAIVETGRKIHDELARDEQYDPSRCLFFRRPQGLDIRSRRGRTELEREIALHRPQLVCIGPAYKMVHRRNSGRGIESHEEATYPVLRVLDDLRTRYGFALIVETHSPKGNDTDPYGSLFWMTWPELGLALKPSREQDGIWDVDRNRGDRLTNGWPLQMTRGRRLPWVGVWHEDVNASTQEELL